MSATLNQLRIFETVARLQSFTRAAKELQMSQPAVSIQISRLEEYAGLSLFNKTRHSVNLTTAGVEMLNRSKEIISAFRAMDNSLDQLKGIPSGTLSVCFIGAAAVFFPDLLKSFMLQHPTIRLKIALCNRNDVLVHLKENLADLGILASPPSKEDMVSEVFAPNRYIIVANPSHPLASRKRIPLGMLMKEPFIVREIGSDVRRVFEDTLGDKAQKVRIFFEINCTETMKQAVLNNMGIACVSINSVMQELERGDLVELDVPGFPALYNWHVVYRKENHLPPVANAFKDFLLTEGAAIVAGKNKTTARKNAKTG